MKLAIAFVYNEIDYIAKAVEYYRAQGLYVYVIDNMSTDGTYEWLVENKVDCHRFDTQNAFQLQWLQNEMITVIEQLKPDWFVWFAPDLFHIFEKNIWEEMNIAEEEGYNQIKSVCYCFKNIGNIDYSNPLPGQCTHAYINRGTLLISKYQKGISIKADRISLPNLTMIKNTGIILEYGGCKSIAIQEAKLKRRKRAWELGTPKGHGIHYIYGKERNWIYDKKELVNVSRLPNYKEAVKKII